MSSKNLKINWKLKNIQDELEIEYLADSLNIPIVLARLLVLRGINNFSKAKKFFRPSLQYLYDPFLMEGMDKSTLRIIEALTNNEKILIYGDYDVDGTCSTALMYLFLKELGADVQYFIPNRMKDGYGLTKVGIDYAKEIGASLIISVDCGITAIEEADYAKSIGIDLIISDHHKPKNVYPNAFSVLDPQKESCNYPYKYLCGAGVAFKIIQGIAERIGKRDITYKYLDLVALACAADIVPLKDENRILVSEGLKIINNSPRPGIKALIDVSKLNGSLSSGQIVFILAPRINAVGRLGDAKIAVELLISDSYEKAQELAIILNNENIERRRIDEITLEEALQKIDSSIDLNDDYAIVLHDENWHPGVIGIVASRLVETYYRPAIMLTTVDGIAKGSARSISSLNIYEALRDCEDLLLHYGGHEGAAGLAIELTQLNNFKKKFNDVVKQKISFENLTPEIEIDSKIKLNEITPKFIRILDQFTPFGPGNMRPVFMSEDVMIVNHPRIVGKNHLSLIIKQDGCDRVFDAIGFEMGNEFINLLNSNARFNLVFSIDKYIRDGKIFPQIRIKDIKLNSDL